MKAAGDTFERLNVDIAEVDHRIAELKTAGDVTTEEDLTAARHARDQGWALVRGLYIDRESGLEELAHLFAPDGLIAGTYERRGSEADRSLAVIRGPGPESTAPSFSERNKAALE